ncbi:aminopeptidase N-like [Planococcus citri]|uniref:aminopeptidase N-like n=1 Tax=Planococcus citri TaxID=170843 RepID=UPI0031F9C606
MNINMKIFIIVGLIFLCFAKIPRTNGDGNFYRLPNQKIKVYKYDLRIAPFANQDSKFEGEVSINTYTYTATECLTMNSVQLNIKEIRVFSSHMSYKVTFETLSEKEMLQICVHPTLPSYTSTTITILYSGEMRNDFKGLFRIQYEENGTKKLLAATQFEPTYARMVFPCFDEPQYSAKFAISIARYNDQTATSITPLSSTSEKDPNYNNRVWDTFQNTPPIPPYMVSFALHQFSVNVNTSNQVNVYSRNYIVDCSKHIASNYLSWYDEFEKYMQIKVPYPPNDLIALPDGDEYLQKAGLTTYREKDICKMNGIAAEKQEEEVTRSAVHKLTHLWLGMYAAPHWWEDTWLSESLATLFEYLIAAKIEPMWNVDDNLVVEVLQDALFEEEIYSDTSLSSPVDFPNEIQNRKFNTFINKKGASLIRMLHYIVGPSRFQTAIRNALQHAYYDRALIQPNYIWDEVQDQIHDTGIFPTDITAQKFMETWITNSGFPLITVFNINQSHTTIKQEVYRSPRSIKSIPRTTWIVPVFCSTKQSTTKFTSTKPTIWLQNEQTDVNMNLKNEEWILCNVDKIGYFRVNYDDQNWAFLTNQLKSDLHKIDSTSRAQLIDDYFQFAIDNKRPFLGAFHLAKYLEKESDMLPWLSFVKYIKFFLRFYEETDAIEYLKNYFSNLIEQQYKRVGFKAQEKDSYAVKTGRPYILEIACLLELSDCLTNAAQAYHTFINNSIKIASESRYAVYCSSFKIIKNKQMAWNDLWKIYKNSQTMSEKELILSALACADDENIYKRYLLLTIKNNPDVPLFKFEKDLIIKSVTSSFKGVTAALDTIEGVISESSTSLNDTNYALISMITQASLNIQSNQHITKLKQIISKMENSDMKNSTALEKLKSSLNTSRKRHKYRDENIDEIKQAIHNVTGYIYIPTKKEDNSTPYSDSNSTPIPTRIPSKAILTLPGHASYFILCLGVVYFTIIG